MANEQGLLKQTVFAKQTSGLGVPATTGGKIKRRTSAVFSKMVDTYESNEIVSHQQSTGANAGIVKTSGKFDGLVSPGTFTEQFASLLRKDSAATAAISGIATLTVAASGANWTLTRDAGDFLGGGIKVGDVVRITASSINAANGASTLAASKNLLVLGVTALALTVRAVNGSALAAQAITTATVTVAGKKTWVPTGNHTNDYWTVEEWYSGLMKSELFTDCKIAKADVVGNDVGSEHYWLGHRPSTPDGLPCIGVASGSPDIIHAFGHGHVGMIQAPASGRLVASLIAGRAPGYDASPFSARRFSFPHAAAMRASASVNSASDVA